jgi:hypothetical protein
LSGKSVTGRRLNVGDFGTTAPSTLTKTSPANGAAGFSTSVTLDWDAATGATGYEYCIDTTNDNTCSGWTSTGTTTSVAVTLQTATANFWQARAVNSGAVTEADDGTWWAISTLGAAKFNSARQAPTCVGLSSACDSGVSLDGRDSIGNGPEPNQPDTLNDSCSDGTGGTYHSDESIDRIRVSTADGADFAPGKNVNIEVTAWIFSSTSNKIDLYYSASASSPSWIFIATLTPSGTKSQTLSTTYTLPAGALQAVRAQLRFGGTASSSCVSGSFNDRDDLAFRVQSDAFTDDTLTPGVHQMRAVHITELRTRINDLRTHYGLATVSWTDTTLGSTVPVRAVHLTEMRSALDAIYTALSRTLPTYTDPTLVAGTTVIKAVHITELRSAVVALE